jgi:hypothetical protein
LEKGNAGNEMNAMGRKGAETHFSRSYMNDGLNKTVKNRTGVEYKIQAAFNATSEFKETEFSNF